MIEMGVINMTEKYVKLKKDVKERRDEYNEKRKEYDKRVRWGNMFLSVLPLMSSVTIFMSILLSGKWEIVMKVFGLVFSVLTILLGYYMRNENYGGKLLQRTRTYFGLCELYNKMKYSEITEEQYKKFVAEFNQIMDKDNKMSFENSQIIVELLRNNYKAGIEREKEFDNEK